MPRIKQDKLLLSPKMDIGLWKVTESLEEMLAKCPSLLGDSAEYERFKSVARRMEYLVERALLQDMLGEMPNLTHAPSGKPLLQDGRKVSISHTKGLVAVILSDDCDVAIDVEYLSERVCAIADRFLREDEEAETVLQKLLAWCAKETLYKLHSEDFLSFSDMRVVSFPDVQVGVSGYCYIDNLKNERRVRIEYIVDDSHILTYAVDKTH